MIEKIYFIFTCVALFLVFGMSFTLSISVRTIGKHFDIYFKDKVHYYDDFLPGVSLVNRTIRYIICIVCNRNKKDKLLNRLYGSYDFRSHASKFEYYLGAAFLIQMSLIGLLSIILLPLQLLKP
jgi:hypothetical protein